MALLEETQLQIEGGNALKSFFMHHDKLKMDWYEKLMEQEIEYDDLMESTENSLREMLKDCGLKSGAILKIINAIRERPKSKIYKDYNKVKVSIISAEESKANFDVEQKINQIDKTINGIANMMDSLNVNYEECRKAINIGCDEIIKHTNQRRNKLLTQLSTIADAKKNQLSKQRNSLSKQHEKLNVHLANTQIMIKDVAMNPKKRKIKILKNTKQILSRKIDLNLAAGCDRMNVEIDVQSINEMISNLGTIIVDRAQNDDADNMDNEEDDAVDREIKRSLEETINELNIKIDDFREKMKKTKTADKNFYKQRVFLLVKERKRCVQQLKQLNRGQLEYEVIKYFGNQLLESENDDEDDQKQMIDMKGKGKRRASKKGRARGRNKGRRQ